jgi:hypothetical protein
VGNAKVEMIATISDCEVFKCSCRSIAPSLTHTLLAIQWEMQIAGCQTVQNQFLDAALEVASDG